MSIERPLLTGYLPTSAEVNLRSCLMTSGMRGANANHDRLCANTKSSSCTPCHRGYGNLQRHEISHPSAAVSCQEIATTELRIEKTDRWKLIEYWFRRENRGNDAHFKLVGLTTTTSLGLISGEIEATMVSFPGEGSFSRPVPWHDVFIQEHISIRIPLHSKSPVYREIGFPKPRPEMARQIGWRYVP